MMRSRLRNYSTLLLSIFVVGGLLSPVAHRISHIYSLDHRHGGPAAGISLAEAARMPGADFLVEERTPVHELTCELCARIGFHFTQIAAGSALLPVASESRAVDPGAPSGRTASFSCIRAPPLVS